MVLIADDKTTFELSPTRGKFGFKILRNGKVDSKWNEAEKLFKAFEPIVDVFDDRPYSGSVFAILNDGTVLFWAGQWWYYVRENKVEADLALDLLDEPNFFGSTALAKANFVKERIPQNKNGTSFNWAEYFQASITSRRYPAPTSYWQGNKERVDGGVTWGLWGTHYNDAALNWGASIDLKRLGATKPEVNAKWGTSKYDQPKGAMLKILVSTVSGLVGGPVGAIIGFGVGIAGVEAQKKAALNATREESKLIQTAVATETSKALTLVSGKESSPAEGFFSKGHFVLFGIIGAFFLLKPKR